MKKAYFMLILVLALFLNGCNTKKQNSKDVFNKIRFEISPYGLLFTQLKIDNDSVKSMIDFGAHFEKFLVPTMVKGEMEMPSKVHLFYFDSMDGIQQMATDPRMMELYPIRDKAVSNATLILGKSL